MLHFAAVTPTPETPQSPETPLSPGTPEFEKRLEELIKQLPTKDRVYMEAIRDLTVSIQELRAMLYASELTTMAIVQALDHNKVRQRLRAPTRRAARRAPENYASPSRFR